MTETVCNEQTRALLKRVNSEKPQAADVSALKKLFDEDSRLWLIVGDAAATAIENTINAVHSSSGLQRECTRRKVEDLKSQLSAGEATPLERLLIDHAAMCWLRLHVTEATYSHLLLEAASHSPASGIYWEKRLGARSEGSRAPSSRWQRCVRSRQQRS